MKLSTPLQKLIFGIILLCGVLFSIISIASSYFFLKGRNQQKSLHFVNALNTYYKAIKINPLSTKSLINSAFLLYNMGIEQKNNDLLKQSLCNFKEVTLLGGNSPSTDYMLLELQRILKISSSSYYDNLKYLIIKYPYHLFILKKYIKESLQHWHDINFLKKSEIFRLSKEIITEDFWQHKDVLDLFFDKRFNFEDIKKVLPKKPAFLNMIPLYYNSSLPKIDYFWLKQEVARLKEASQISQNLIDIKENNKVIKTLEKQWLKTFGTPNFKLLNTQLFTKNSQNNYEIGGDLFCNGKVSGMLNITQPDFHLDIIARSSSLNDIFAFMNIYLDGMLIAGSYIENENYQVYKFPLHKIKPGLKLIEIAFENDGYDKEQQKDRNLFIKEIKIKNYESLS